MRRNPPAAAPPSPTDAELDLLRVLWDRGASTVREVFDAVGAGKGIGYTTVLKQMQVMHRKGLLARTERFRAHVYEPTINRSATQRKLAWAVMQRVFDGSARGLLQSALAGRKVDARELDDIRRMLDDYQRKAK